MPPIEKVDTYKNPPAMAKFGKGGSSIESARQAADQRRNESNAQSKQYGDRASRGQQYNQK